MGTQPKFVIRFVCKGYVGYYSKLKSWGGVERKDATELTHAEATFLANRLGSHNIGADCIVEPVAPKERKPKKQRGNVPQVPVERLS